MVSVGAVEGNDPPSFGQDQYQVNVVEHSPPEAFVIQLNATDLDGSNDLIRYRIVGGSAVDWFNVDELSGIVRVAKGGRLEWDLKVAAIDQGSPLPHTSTATINIQVYINISFLPSNLLIFFFF